MHRRLSLLFVLLVASVVAKEPLEFTAYLTTDGETRVVLRDPTSGGNSGWLARGENYRGFTVGRFHPATESLTVTHAGDSLVLVLRSSQIRQVEADRLLATELERRVQETRKILAVLSQRYRAPHPTLIKQRQTLAQLEHQLAELRTRG